MASNETTKQFGERIFSIFLDSLTVLHTSLGSRLGLFDVLATFDVPKTSQEIASKAGYRERYVREWLNVMMVSDIVEINPEGNLYFLPHHRREVLAGNGRAVIPTLATRWISVLAYSQDDLMKAFSSDGPLGTTYDLYPHFHETMNTIREAGFDGDMFDDAYKKVPDLKAKLENGIQVCEVGFGNGVVSLYFAEAFPNSTITGLDFNPDVVKALEKNANERGLKNIKAVVQNASTITDDWANKFDYIFICDTIHDVPFSTECVKNLYKMLKPEGYLSVMELVCHTNPAHNASKATAKFAYGVSLAHCLPISHNYPCSEALGAGWGKERCRELLESVGFKDYTFIKDYELEYHCIVRK